MKLGKKVCVFALCCVTVFLFAGCTLVGNGPVNNDMSSMVEGVYPAVVSIEASTSLTNRFAGSGVIIYSEGEYNILVTNFHVIADSNNRVFNSIKIIHWSNKLYRGNINTQNSAELESYSMNLDLRSGGILKSDVLLYPAPADLTDANLAYAIQDDLAIIKYKPHREEFRYIAASMRSTELRVGEPIAALGYSLGEFHRASFGHVSQVFPTHKFFDGTNQRVFDHSFLHDAITVPGNSGGPIFDAKGDVIGLTTMLALLPSPPFADDVPALGFSIAIGARHIEKVWRENREAWGFSIVE